MLSADNVSAVNFDELMGDGLVGAQHVLQVVLRLGQDQAELGVDFLMQHGARAVEERQVGEEIELWSVIGDTVASAECISQCAGQWSGRLVWVDTTPSDDWKQFAQPVVVNSDLVIIPSWKDASPLDHYKLNVFIDPEESFGLGDHPTTRLVAGALTRQNLSGVSVLDMGSGSGVLSIVAALCGAQRVLGIDRALGAAAIAQRNAVRNGVADTVEFQSGSAVPSEETFGLAAANILAPVLLEIAESLVDAVEVGGMIILSGLHIERSAFVVERYVSLGCSVVEEASLDNWFAVVMKRMR
jgi:ribosomal protein L11 methyltransferase